MNNQNGVQIENFSDYSRCASRELGRFTVGAVAVVAKLEEA